MTLAGLIQHVRERTGAADADILHIVRVAWPSHFQFTETQAALVVNSIVHNRRRQPKTLTEEQLWGKS